ncbi:MAG: hypothetical protein LBR36_02555 [Bacteroidales bacterium]|jgi:hypothetical protein|nr:hypothetical protein [Bacteroidales bacterium]
MNKIKLKDANFDKKLLFWGAYITCIICALYPFFQIGFTTADDLEYYMCALSGDYAVEFQRYARNTGRFYFLITKIFYHFPYIVDNLYFTKIIQYSTLSLAFVLFAMIIKKIFHSKELSLFVLLLLFAFLPITQNLHIAIIAYPFYFAFSYSLFLGAILLFLVYTERQKMLYLVISVLLMAISLLFYENYLLYLFFFGIFIFIRNWKIYGKTLFLKSTFYKEIVPFVAIGVLFCMVYFGYRMYVSTERGFYSGVTLAQDFNWKNFFSIIWGYNKTAFPTFIFFDKPNYLQIYSLLPAGHISNFWYVLVNASIAVKMGAILLTTLLFVLLKNLQLNFKWSKICIVFLLFMFFMFSVHLIIATTEKYNSNDWWANCAGYATTFYSYGFVIGIIALTFIALLKAFSKKKWLKNIAICIVLAINFCWFIIMGYTNEHLSRIWQHEQRNITMMDKLQSANILDTLPQDAAIYLGKIRYTNPMQLDFCNIFGQNSSSCSDYFSLKYHKKYNIFEKSAIFKEYFEQNTQKPVYYLEKIDISKSLDVLMAFSKINANSISIDNTENSDSADSTFLAATTNESVICFYSPVKVFSILFSLSDSLTTAGYFYINNMAFPLQNGINAITISNKNIRKEMTTFTLKSDIPFYATQFSVSTIGKLDIPIYEIE